MGRISNSQLVEVYILLILSFSKLRLKHFGLNKEHCRSNGLY